MKEARQTLSRFNPIIFPTKWAIKLIICSNYILIILHSHACKYLAYVPHTPVLQSASVELHRSKTHQHQQALRGRREPCTWWETKKGVATITHRIGDAKIPISHRTRERWMRTI